jgi:hypothetical protein
MDIKEKTHSVLIPVLASCRNPRGIPLGSAHVDPRWTPGGCRVANVKELSISNETNDVYTIVEKQIEMFIICF